MILGSIPRQNCKISCGTGISPSLVFSALFLALILAGTASARTMFVAPSSEVPLRVAPDPKRKIVAILSDGTQVDLVTVEGDWAKVRTARDKEGWILKRYLSSSPPLQDRVNALSKENKQLKKKLKELKASEKSSSSERDSCIAQRDEIMQKYENLKIEAADAINTKKLLQETTKELNQAKQEVALLKSRLEDTVNNERLKWFLAGGGVLLTGWILGVLFRRRERRRLSLL